MERAPAGWRNSVYIAFNWPRGASIERKNADVDRPFPRSFRRPNCAPGGHLLLSDVDGRRRDLERVFDLVMRDRSLNRDSPGRTSPAEVGRDWNNHLDKVGVVGTGARRCLRCYWRCSRHGYTLWAR